VCLFIHDQHHRYEKLIAGYRTGFGFHALNDAAELIRKAGLEAMGVAAWDGPATKD